MLIVLLIHLDRFDLWQRGVFLQVILDLVFYNMNIIALPARKTFTHADVIIHVAVQLSRLDQLNLMLCGVLVSIKLLILSNFLVCLQVLLVVYRVKTGRI